MSSRTKKDDPSSTLTISEEARGRLDNHSLGRSTTDPTAEWANFEHADLLQASLPAGLTLLDGECP